MKKLLISRKVVFTILFLLFSIEIILYYFNQPQDIRKKASETKLTEEKKQQPIFAKDAVLIKFKNKLNIKLNQEKLPT